MNRKATNVSSTGFEPVNKSLLCGLPMFFKMFVRHIPKTNTNPILTPQHRIFSVSIPFTKHPSPFIQYPTSNSKIPTSFFQNRTLFLHFSTAFSHNPFPSTHNLNPILIMSSPKAQLSFLFLLFPITTITNAIVK